MEKRGTKTIGGGERQGCKTRSKDVEKEGRVGRNKLEKGEKKRVEGIQKGYFLLEGEQREINRERYFAWGRSQVILKSVKTDRKYLAAPFLYR